MVRLCRSLSATSLRMSANSWAWNVFSANHLSTTTGSERLRSTYASAWARVPSLARSSSKVASPSDCFVLTTMTVGLALRRDRLGQRAEQVAPVRAGVRRLRRCAHHHQLVVGGLLDDRLAHAGATRGSARSRAACRRARARRRRPRPARARRPARRCPWARRAARPPSPPKRLARSRLMRMASSACGPPRTGTRIDSTWSRPRCLTTAMSHGDSRTTASMVGREDRSRAGPLAGQRHLGGLRLGTRGLRRRRRTAPAEDDEVASPPRRPPRSRRRRHGGRCGPSSAARPPPRRRSRARAGAGVARCAPGWRPRERLTPSGTSTMPRAVISVGRPLATPAPMRTRSRAVRGLASGSRIRYGVRRRARRHQALPAPRASCRPPRASRGRA